MSGGTNNILEAPIQQEEGLGCEIGITQKKRLILLFVVGGLTFLEIAALRFLSNEPSFPYKILISTTAIVNGNTFLNSISNQ